MARRLLAWLILGAMLIPTAAVSAQGLGPADLVRAFLSGKGYTVEAAGYLTDDNGNATTMAAVAMDSVGSTLSDQNVWAQAYWGFVALRQYYGNAQGLFSLLGYRQYIFVFPVTAQLLDQYNNKQIDASTFWSAVSGKVDVYDSDRKTFVGTQNFTANNQTTKDYGAGNNTNSCNLKQGETGVAIQNNYRNQTMRFTIGGGEWGTHDYDVPGDAKFWVIHMPPGRYTYTASIAGRGVDHGERFDYQAGVCYRLVYSP